MASLHPSSSPLTFDHESPRERWRLVRWAPPRLSRFVAGIWYFEGRLALPNERHYPNGQLDLVLQFGPRYRRVGGPALAPPTRLPWLHEHAGTGDARRPVGRTFLQDAGGEVMADSDHPRPHPQAARAPTPTFTWSLR